MQDPRTQIRDVSLPSSSGLQFMSFKVVRAITEPDASEDLLRAVDKYFTLDAVIIHPMFSALSAIISLGLA